MTKKFIINDYIKATELFKNPWSHEQAVEFLSMSYYIDQNVHTNGALRISWKDSRNYVSKIIIDYLK